MVEDDGAARNEQCLRMEWVLELIKAKNGDLEARSRRNNIRIVGVPESMVMGIIKTYAGDLIRTLFGEHLAAMFAVE